MSIFGSDKRTFKAPVPLNFKNHKYQIYQSTNEHLGAKGYYTKFLVLNGVLWFFFLRAVYRIKIFRAILWGIPTYIVTKMTRGIKSHYDTFITHISLLDDG